MKLALDWHKREVYEGKIMPVIVANPEDIVIPRVDPVRAEHFVTLSFPVPVLSIQQILELDPLRIEAVISIVGGGQLTLCHSLTQATSDAKGQSLSGAVFGASGGTNQSITLRAIGTAPLWVVGLSGSTLTVGIFGMRRAK